MSEEVKIDVKYLRNQALMAVELSKLINRETEIMIDENEDLFVRYIALARLRAIVKGVNMALEVMKDNLIKGHNLHHPLMQTPKAIENDWDKINLEQDDFFTTEKQEKSKSFREMIGAALFGALKEDAKESNKETPVTP